MIYNVLEADEASWRRLNGCRLVPVVRAVARFVKRELVETTGQKDAA